MQKVLTWVVLCLVCGAASAGGALNLVVNGTLDEPDEVIDGVCDTISNVCTLRAALMEANQHNGGTTHISFNINDPGCHNEVCVIQVNQGTLGHLPDIVKPVNIDGSTQPNNSGVCDLPIASRPDYKIVLQGQSTEVGLRLEAGSDGSVIRGLNIRNFFNNLVIFKSNDNRVECNFIGTDETGMASSGNNPANGLLFGCDSSGNVIGGSAAADGNLIAAQDSDSIQFYAGFTCTPNDQLPHHNAILGNYIGTMKDGVTPLGSVYSGISFFGGAAHNNFIGSLQDGSTILGNVIGNHESGIYIADGTNNTLIVGNYIGTDPSGSADLGHVFGGVDIIDGYDNQVGGALPGEGNLVAYNSEGVFVTDLSSFGNQIRGNDYLNNLTAEVDVIADGGIDPDGLNPNDTDDADVGTNLLMNHPVITATSFIDVSGDLFSEVEFSVDASLANAAYPIEIDAYFNDEPGLVDKAVYTDSQTYVFPQQSTMAVFDIPDGITGGELRLVATDADGNSSELSPPFIVGIVDLIFKDGFD